MRRSQNYLPNVITFVTIFRALGKANLHQVDAKETRKIILELLSCAQEISADDRSSLPTGTANENGLGVIVDITIYNAALSTCVWLSYPVTAQEILFDMVQRGSGLNAVSFKIISKLVARCDENSREGIINKLEEFNVPDGGMLQHLSSVGAVTANDAFEIGKLLAIQRSAKEVVESNSKCASSHSSGQYAGCLGPDAAEDLRQCVIDHDLRKLIERPEGFSESDFATLIHQCRKRKWPKQVDVILSFMTQRVSVVQETSSTFNPSPSMPSTSHPWLSTESSYNLRRCIVALTWTIYEAALDAYFCMDLADKAFAMYKLILEESVDSSSLRRSLQSQDNMVFVLKGFLRCGRADCAVFAFESYSLNCPPSRQLVMGIMHGLGKGNNYHLALGILAKLFEKSLYRVDSEVHSLRLVDATFPRAELNLETVPFSLQSCKVFLVTLLESCAVLGNIEGASHVLCESLLVSVALDENKVAADDRTLIVQESSYICMLLRDLIESEDCDFISVCLMVCASHGNVTHSHDLLFSWQSAPLKYLPPHLFLHSLMAESFAQTTSSVSQLDAASKINSLPFRGFARFGAVRHLDKRRSFIRQTVPKLRVRRLNHLTPVANIFNEIPSAVSHVSFISDETSDETSTKGDFNSRETYLYHIIGERVPDISHISGCGVRRPDEGLNEKNDDGESHHLSISIISKREEDILLTHYLLITLGLNDCTSPTVYLASGNALTDEGQSDYALPCLLLLQHLETRLLRIRDKNAKGLLQRQIIITFSRVLQIARSAQTSPSSPSSSPAFEMMIYARHLVKYSLHALNILDLNGKQCSRLISTLLEGMDCWALSSSKVFDGPLLKDLSIAVPCLEVLKELQRLFHILNFHDGAITVSDILLTLLEKDREKLVKVVIFMQQQHLLAVVNACKLESLLVTALRNSPEGSWSAVMAFMTGMGDLGRSQSLEGTTVTTYSSISHTRDACRRVVRQLLSYQDKGQKDNVNIACRLLCKYEISDDIEFRTIFTSVREDIRGSGTSTVLATTINEVVEDKATQYFPSFYSRCNILWIDGSDMSLLSRASDILLGMSCDVVGIDVEWRPYSTGSLPWPCSLLQIGCRTHCFLFDLLAFDPLLSHPELQTGSQCDEIVEKKMECERSLNSSVTNCCSSFLANDVFSSLLSSLFTNSSILKLGFGLSGDFKRLESSFPTSKQYSSLNNVFDIASAPCYKGKGLSAMSLEVLGSQVDKRFQMSDWQRRPLSEDQINYAATDAGVLIAIYDAMRKS